jgi:hypothetical protein
VGILDLGSWFLQRLHSECIPSECRMPQVEGQIKSNVLLATRCVSIHICIYLGTRQRENQYRTLSKIAHKKQSQKIDTKHRKYQ